MPTDTGHVPGDEGTVTCQAIIAPFERDVLLATGRAVRVRPAAPSDVDGLRTFYGRLDDRSNYLRFFSLRRFIPDVELERATVHDAHLHVTLVAEASGTIVGVGEYHAAPGAEDAEVAFAVADAHHHEGIATVLLEDLALIAQAAGFRRLMAETLPDNAAMLGVFRSVGLVHRVWFEDGVVRVQLDLTADDLLQDDADLRDWKAAVRSLRSILEPSHVVVLGADDDATSPGRRVLAHLCESFRGRVSVVHRTNRNVDGIDTVAAIDDLEDVPDLAVIAVAAPLVADAVERCGAAGVPSAVVISEGFAEVGPDAAHLQEKVLAVARRHGMRVVGPNCLGVVSTACGLNATVINQTFAPGGIAVASQSGGVGVAITAEAQRRQAGISSFVSMGNKIDVSGNDLLRLWANDESTQVVLLYLESFGDPVRFARVARAVSQRKPIVALKSGGSPPGERGARAHSAALASDEAMVDALFTHAGVVRARTLEELIDVGLLLDLQAAPAGRRVALIGNAGGPLILGADAADAGGLDVPLLSAELQGEISALAPTAVSSVNPVDLGAIVPPHQLAAVVKAIGRSEEVDGCIVVCVDLGERRHLEDVGGLLAADRSHGVPLALSLIGPGASEVCAVPTFPTPERAAVAMALAARRAAWLASLTDDDGRNDTSRVDAGSLVDIRRLARRHAGDRTDVTWLDTAASLDLLDMAGLPVVSRAHARSVDVCTDAADGTGHPCGVEADIADLVHASDSGAVRPGARDALAGVNTSCQFRRQFGDHRGGVLAQAEEMPTIELRVGAIRDPAFGPLVLVGARGVDAELRDDRVVLVAPVAASAARRALESLRLAPLFHGFHGRPELPVDRVVELIQRTAVLAAAVPEIQQVDINPVLVGPQGCVVVDASIGVAASRSTVVPVRGLRGPTPQLPRGVSQRQP